MQTCFGSAQRSSAMCSEVAAGEGGSEELLEGVVDWGGGGHWRMRSSVTVHESGHIRTFGG